MANRLAHETSPYLLQHQHNPVDWYPWGPEAFARAIELDRPIFLSVGYSSCHWCHVMEHESFEDEEVARALNESFVSIKVDREERPDVDEAYMTAIQMMSARGGWPMSVFLTPERQPFFGGTYFPKEDRGGHPGMLTLLHHIDQAWKTRREEILAAGAELAVAVANALNAQPPSTTSELGQAAFAGVIEQLAANFDAENGGFGQAPKFPPHTSLEFLNSYSLLEASSQEQAEVALAMSLSTLVRMSLGGIRDHVGGGFHRYSTDAYWRLPHFEKMLYDNALMVGNLAMASMICEEFDPPTSKLLRRTADQTVQWLQSDMLSPQGLFYSAVDADSEGEEGRYYVWTEEEIRQLLGERAEAFVSAYGVLPHGNFADEATGERTGANVLLLREDVEESFAEELATLRAARSRRVKPQRDEKCLIAWNGLAVDGLSVAGYLPLAAQVALSVLEFEREYGSLPRHVTQGVPAGDAYLEDYAYFIAGLLRLGGLTALVESDGALPEGFPGAAIWEEEARRLTREMVELFYDEAGDGFFSISSRHEPLFGPSKPVFDQPTPSANAVAIRCLIETGDDARANRSLQSLLGWMEKAPHATEALWSAALSAAFERADEPVTVAPPGRAPQEVTARLAFKELHAAEDGWAEGLLLLSIPKGQHLNSHAPNARWIVPTQVQIRPLESKVTYPETTEDRYEGEIAIPFRVRLPAASRAEEFELEISFQACTESECFAPKSHTFSGVVAYEART